MIKPDVLSLTVEEIDEEMNLRFDHHLKNACGKTKIQVVQLNVDRIYNGNGKGLKLPPLMEEDKSSEVIACHSRVRLLAQEAYSLPLSDNGQRVLTRGLLLFARVQRLNSYFPSSEATSLMFRIRGLILAYSGFLLPDSTNVQTNLKFGNDSDNDDDGVLDINVSYESELEVNGEVDRSKNHDTEGREVNRMVPPKAKKLKTIPEETPQDLGSRSCFRCGAIGHQKKECPNTKRVYSEFQKQKRRRCAGSRPGSGQIRKGRQM